MLDIKDIVQLIIVIGTLFFILGAIFGPRLIHQITKTMGYFIGPKYLKHRGQKTIKKMDVLR